MKLMLTKDLVIPINANIGRKIDSGSVGEAIKLHWDLEGRVVKVRMAFYGNPGTYLIDTKDLSAV